MKIHKFTIKKYRAIEENITTNKFYNLEPKRKWCVKLKKCIEILLKQWRCRMEKY